MEEAKRLGLVQQLTMLQNTSKRTPNNMTSRAGTQMFYPNAQNLPTQPVPSGHQLGQPPPSTQTQPAAPAIVTPGTQNSTIYSPNSSMTQNNTIYSPSSLSTQNTTIYSSDLSNTQNIANVSPHANTYPQIRSSPCQPRNPILQSPFQPPRSYLPSGLVPSSSVGGSSQYAHHANTGPLQRHYRQVHSSHFQRSRDSSQARYQPYGSTPNRSPHLSHAPVHGTSHPRPRSSTSTPPCVHSQRPESSHVNYNVPVSSFPHGPPMSRGLDNILQSHPGTSRVLPTNPPAPFESSPHGPSQSHLPPGLSKRPLHGTSQVLPAKKFVTSRVASQSQAQPHVRVVTQTPMPVDSTPHSTPENNLPPLSSHGASQSYVGEAPQTPQPKPSPSMLRPQEELQPQVWADWLDTVTRFTPQLQAQTYPEDSIEKQKALLEKVQQRSLSELRAHEFLEYLTMDYNALFKPVKARVYDFYIMQALLFNGDFVLLVSSRCEESLRLEPPQSIWHAYDLSEYRHHAQIELHIHTTLNRITNLIPDDLVLCAGYERHDSAINAIDDNGRVQYGWSSTLCYEVKLSHIMPTLHNHSADFEVRPIHRKDIKNIKNIDPVWKAKLLGIFKAREEHEDALKDMQNAWR